MADEIIQFNETEQKLLANIEITKANLYVFCDSKEKERWEKMLVDAKDQFLSNPKGKFVYAQEIVNRINEVVSNLWDRIKRWQELQRKTIGWFIGVILLELITVAVYYYRVDVVEYGFYTSMLFGLLGGSLGVALNVGKNLDIAASNRLWLLRLIFRPLIGIITAILLFALLQLKIFVVTPELDQGSVLMLLSIFAGYSERFTTKVLDDYIPKFLEK